MKQITDNDVIHAAKKILEGRISYAEGGEMTDPKAVMDYFKLRLEEREREVFSVMFLNARHKVIRTVDMFTGTIDGASVHVREIIKAALIRNATAIIIAHNHPSGEAEPSRSDIVITSRIQEACKLMDIRLLDHIVVGKTCVSFAERGLI